MDKTVVELFAGVGGFRVGLNNIKKISKSGKAIENGPWDFVWSNQWEPSTKKQYAFDCYNKRFPSKHNINVDITKINKNDIPDHTLLTGGFPCQDYSVAHTLSKSRGIEGKKGVLWWQINEILLTKKPPFVLLENVDRLIKSPASQRGRDFGIMLRCFFDAGYGIEWRVINSADYGHPQKRRRIFLFAFKNTTKYFNSFSANTTNDILTKKGIFAKTFPVSEIKNSDIRKTNVVKKYKDLVSVSDKFQFKFENSGYMLNGDVYTAKLFPILDKASPLSKFVIKDKVDDKYFLSKEKTAKFKYLRGAKRIPRTDKNGFKYFYSEGSMSPYDSLSRPSRTMLTSEGTTNRSTHIINDPLKHKLRLLTPIECERINQFPDNWTNTEMPERKRYFMMGNALVCGLVTKIGNCILDIIKKED